MKICGVDPSLTSTGVAVISGDPDALTVATHRVESAPPKRARGDKAPPTLEERRFRVAALCIRVGEHLYGEPPLTRPDLVVVEGPAYAAVGGSAWDRAFLWWSLVAQLLTSSVPVAVSPPGVAAKWATGKGRAEKGMVAAHLARMFPDLSVAISEDEFDAVALAALGAQHVALMPADLARHREQLARVQWPEMVAGVGS